MNPSITEFLDKSFNGIESAIQSLEQLGYAWKDLSIPFTVIRDGLVIAHAGVLELQWKINNNVRRFGAIHAVCTHPSYRKQGYAREVIVLAVDYCRGLYENVVLFTDIPKLYAPFGFVPIQEHRFRVQSLRTAHGKKFQCIPLMANDKKHISLFKELSSLPHPQSDVFSCLHTGPISAFHSLRGYPYFQNLYYAEPLETIIAYKQEGNQVQIFDVFGKRQLDFDALISCFDSDVAEVCFYFSPDQFTEQTEAIPFTEDGYVMALRPDLMPHQPFMVPVFSRC